MTPTLVVLALGCAVAAFALWYHRGHFHRTTGTGPAADADELRTKIAHELCAPLTSIVGYLELVCDGSVGPLAAEQRLVLDRVSRHAEHLTAVVDSLLELSTIDPLMLIGYLGRQQRATVVSKSSVFSAARLRSEAPEPWSIGAVLDVPRPGSPAPHATDPIQLAAAAVLAEANAIAAVADAEIAAELQTTALRAARRAEHEATAAARTVAHAAESARRAQEIATSLAAADVAVTAARTAMAVQDRADGLAAAELSAAESAVRHQATERPGPDDVLVAAGVAAQVRATAAAKADETAQAAWIVAQAVAAAASEIAAASSAIALATELEVVHAATAMQVIVDSTADAVHDATSRAVTAALAAGEAAAARREFGTDCVR